jgi:hypothetical protein
MITIGILGSRGKSAVADIIDSFLKGNGIRTCIIGTNQDSSGEFLKLLYEERINFVQIVKFVSIFDANMNLAAASYAIDFRNLFWSLSKNEMAFSNCLIISRGCFKKTSFVEEVTIVSFVPIK